jgi:hypothetical protein
MAGRFVPITITVSGATQGEAEVKGLSNAFTQVHNTANTASGGGLKNAFDSTSQLTSNTSLLRAEMLALVQQIPYVNRAAYSLSNSLISGLDTATRKSASEVAALGKALESAEKKLDSFAQKTAAKYGSAVTPQFLQQFAALPSSSTIRQLPQIKATGALTQEELALGAGIGTADLAGIEKASADFAVLETKVAGASAAMDEGAVASGGLLAGIGAIALPIAAVIALLAVFTLGLYFAGKASYELTNLAKTTGVEIYDLSQKVNFSAETLSVLKVGAKESGTELGNLSASLGIFDKNIQLANESDTKLAKQFKDFNVDISNNETALRTLFQALIALPPGAKQTELAMLAFGRSGKDMLGVIKATGGDIDLTIAKLEKMGLIMSTEDAKSAAEFRNETALLGLQIEMMGVKIGQQLMPYALALDKKLSDLATTVGPNLRRNIIDTLIYLEHLGGAFQDLKKAIDDSHAAVIVSGSTWATTFKGMGDVLLAVVNPPLAIAKGLLGTILDTLVEIDKLKGPALSAIPAHAGLDAQYQNLLTKPDRPVSPMTPLIAEQGFTAEQAAQFTKELGPFRSVFEGINAQVETFGEKSHLARVEQEAMKLSLKDLSPQVRDAAAAYIENAKALARQLDAQVAAKKVNDDAQKTLDSYQKGLDALTEKNNTWGESTHRAAVEQEFAKIKTDNLSIGYKDQLNAMYQAKLVQADMIDARDAAKKADEKAAAANLWLQNQTDSLTEKQAELTDQTRIGTTATEDFRKALMKRSDASIMDAKLLAGVEAKATTVTGLQVTAARNVTAKSLEGLQKQVDSLTGGQGQGQLEGFIQSVIGLQGFGLKENAFAPLMQLVQAAQSNPDAVGALRGFLSTMLAGAEGGAIAPGQLDQTVATIQKLLLTMGHLETPIGQAQVQAQAEFNRLLRDQQAATDPLVISETIRNELLRDKITLQTQDVAAVIASNRAEIQLADSTTYHATQANAKVLEFLASQKGITQIVADAKTGVIQMTYDYITSGLDKINTKLGGLGKLLTQIEGDFIKLALNKFFLWLLGGQGAGTGGGGSSSGTGILAGLFRGGGASSNRTAPSLGGGSSLASVLTGGYAGGPGGGGYLTGGGELASLAGMGGMLDIGGGITAPTTTLTSQVAQQSAATWGGVQSAAVGAGSVAMGGGSNLGLGAMLGPMLPLLGLTLGTQLGGISRFGNAVGGAGGLLAGGIGAAFLAPGMFATTGIFGSMGPAIAGLLTNPFTIAAAGALIVGAILLGRNAQRRKDETTRAQLNGDVYTQVIQILNNARSGQLSLADATSQYNTVKTNYFAGVAQMKDAKTKRIATDWWNNDFNPVYWPLIQQAGQASDNAKATAGKLVPEFASGGYVGNSNFGLRNADLMSAVQGYRHLQFADGGAMSMFGGRVPGLYDRQDNHLIAVSGDEVVLTPQQWKPITKYLTAVKVPGFAGGGAVAPAVSSPRSSGDGTIEITVDSINIDSSGIVFAGLKSSDNRKVVIKTVRGAQLTGQL